MDSVVVTNPEEDEEGNASTSSTPGPKRQSLDLCSGNTKKLMACRPGAPGVNDRLEILAIGIQEAHVAILETQA